MERALALARRGLGRVSPNPMVGAVLVSRGKVFAEGAHTRFGGPHAERSLLARLGRRAVPPDAQLFLTLEPCVHPGKTPPCVPAILERSIRRIVIAQRDPNPRVAGRGVAALRSAGCEVRLGCLAKEAGALNAAYASAHRRGRARIVVKIAASLDARVADHRGAARWITGSPARRLVARLRLAADAVVVGAGTVRIDDPRLAPGRSGNRSFARIVLDSRLSIDPDCSAARLWRREIEARSLAHGVVSPADAPADAQRRGNWIGIARRGGRGAREGGREGRGDLRWILAPRLIVVAGEAPDRRASRFRRKGWEVWRLRERQGRLDLRALARRARREGLLDLLVEPGPRLASSFLESGPVDRLLLFLAPTILGGPRGWSALLPPRRITRPLRPSLATSPRRVGRDLLLELAGKGDGPLIP